MSNRYRDRERRQARRPAFRSQKKTILVVSEGEVTETSYLRGLQADQRNPRFTIKFARDRGDPKTMVSIAKPLKHDFDYDSVWCVFDVDDHPGIPEAMRTARDNGIKLAISNPCFELWVLLHFADQPGRIGRVGLTKRLKKFLKDYDKKIDYATLKSGHDQAIRRARTLEKQARELGDPHRNPSTGVHLLVEMITGKK